MTVYVFTLRSVSHSHYCLPHKSYRFRWENLVSDQLIPPQIDIFLCYITYCLLDIASLLLEEIMSWSLMGAKPVNILKFLESFSK